MKRKPTQAQKPITNAEINARLQNVARRVEILGMQFEDFGVTLLPLDKAMILRNLIALEKATHFLERKAGQFMAGGFDRG